MKFRSRDSGVVTRERQFGALSGGVNVAEDLNQSTVRGFAGSRGGSASNESGVHVPANDSASREVPISGPVSLSCARRVGRYLLLEELARGGMATVHMGRAVSEHGVTRKVAIKRLLPVFTRDPKFTEMMLDEARLAASISHPNVASVIDVVQQDDELFLVLDYIQGDTLARLIRRAPAGQPLPLRVVASVVSGLLHGLHAAHTARDEYDELLELVHRDISPQNVMVGVDGLSRVLDFGIAKALNTTSNTSKGDLKGKLSYMAPEQLRAEPATQASDLYAAGVVLWEALTGRRLFEYASEREALARPRDFVPEGPSKLVPGLPEALDAVVLRALSPDPAERYASARDMALALEAVVEPARASEVGAWVEQLLQRPPQRSSRVPPAAAPTPSLAERASEATVDDEPEPTKVERTASTRVGRRPQGKRLTVREAPARWIAIALLCLAVASAGYAAASGLLAQWVRKAAELVSRG
jgi:serine/threonine protein kinase